jgi:gamma-glutamyltranspeptidase/glutathione hydrolase
LPDGIKLSNLAKYKTISRTPVQSKFLNYTVVSMPPPSSGGIHVVQFLKMLEKEKLEAFFRNSKAWV